jgi:hypothetical protein
VFLLFLIARGEGYYRVHGGVLGDLGVVPADMEAQVDQEQSVIEACRKATASAATRIGEAVPLDEAPETFLCAMAGLAVTTRARPEAATALLDRLDASAVELVRAGARTLRELARDNAASLATLRSAALPGSLLHDYLSTTGEPDDPLTPHDFAVQLLVEDMWGAAAAG